MQDKQKIVFAGEADQAPGTVPGDVVFVLQCKKHPQFLRKGDDLLMERKVGAFFIKMRNIMSAHNSILRTGETCGSALWNEFRCRSSR
jgi:hypothetical protein